MVIRRLPEAPMQFFFVGLAMRRRAHDYGAVHAALFGMRARRVSARIWLCAVDAEASDAVFGRISRALAPDDELLVVEVPQELREPRLVPVAA